jgi:hypothetical protein
MMISSGLLFNPRDFSQIHPTDSVQLIFYILGRICEFGSRFELGQVILGAGITLLDFSLGKAISLQSDSQGEK